MILVFGSLLLLALGIVFFGGWQMGGTPLSGVYAIAGALLGAFIYLGIDRLIRNRRK